MLIFSRAVQRCRSVGSLRSRICTTGGRRIAYNLTSVTSPVEELRTIEDIYRYATTLFTSHQLTFGHGTSTPWEDASFIIMHELQLPHTDPIATWSNARLLRTEREHLLRLIHERLTTKQPSPYLVRGCYLAGRHFYVDERVLIPRSFIAELLLSNEHSIVLAASSSSKKLVEDMKELEEMEYDDYFESYSLESYNGTDSNSNASQPNHNRKMLLPAGMLIDAENVTTVLELGTGSGCLAILAATVFPNASIDATDISIDAL